MSQTATMQKEENPQYSSITFDKRFNERNQYDNFLNSLVSAFKKANIVDKNTEPTSDKGILSIAIKEGTALAEIKAIFTRVTVDTNNMSLNLDPQPNGVINITTRSQRAALQA